MHARDERAKCTLATNGQSARSRRTGKMHARDERAKCTLALALYKKQEAG